MGRLGLWFQAGLFWCWKPQLPLPYHTAPLRESEQVLLAMQKCGQPSQAKFADDWLLVVDECHSTWPALDIASKGYCTQAATSAQGAATGSGYCLAVCDLVCLYGGKPKSYIHAVPLTIDNSELPRWEEISMQARLAQG